MAVLKNGKDQFTLKVEADLEPLLNQGSDAHVQRTLK